MIHKKFPEFFPLGEFDLVLPNKSSMKVRACQAGRKALMSNPNSDLGYYFLRILLNLEEGVLVTYSHLREVGMDSIRLSKCNEGLMELAPEGLGSYKKFYLKSL